MSPRSAYYVLGLLFLVNLLNFTDRMLLAILLEPIDQELGLQDWQLGTLTGLAFAIFYSTIGLPLARWADTGSRRKLIAAALTIWSAMTAATGAASNYAQLMIARMGVGAGEAGCLPAAHSMIADLFRVERRAFAMAILSLGTPIGVFVGMSIGGLLQAVIGWRLTFLVFGLIGLAVTPILLLTLNEPIRGMADSSVGQPEVRRIRMGDALRRLWRVPGYAHLVAAMALGLFTIYGVTQWMPTFFVRSHAQEVADVGTRFGVAFGLGSAIGLILGGRIADVLISRSAEWAAWFPGIAYPLSVPFFLLALVVSDTDAAFVGVLFGSAFTAMPQGPSLAAVQTLVPVELRATASAVAMFAGSIVGAGLAPFAIGLGSDLIQPKFGEESLRYALACSMVVVAWSSFHFYRAGRGFGRCVLRKDVIAAPTS